MGHRVASPSLLTSRCDCPSSAYRSTQPAPFPTAVPAVLPPPNIPTYPFPLLTSSVPWISLPSHSGPMVFATTRPLPLQFSWGACGRKHQQGLKQAGERDPGHLHFNAVEVQIEVQTDGLDAAKSADTGPVPPPQAGGKIAASSSAIRGNSLVTSGPCRPIRLARPRGFSMGNPPKVMVPNSGS